MTDIKTHVIRDPLCQGSGLAHTWIPGDRLSVYANKHVTHLSADQASKLAPCNAKIHEVRSDILLFHPIVRKLVNESAGVFLIAQQLANEPEKDAVNVRLEFIKLSKQYRCIIKACIENLQEVAKSTLDPSDNLTQLQLVKVFYNIEFLWHLCEILYIDVTPGETVLPQLVEWVRFHFFQCEQRAVAMLSGDFGASSLESGLEAEPDYWETINSLVLQGRSDTARALLRHHSCATQREFKMAENVLRSMPVYRVYGGVSTSEFNMRWSGWQHDARAKQRAGEFTAFSNLDFLMKLVCGDEAAFTSMVPQCEAWYRHMVGWLLYTEPTVKSFDLCYHAKQSIQLFGGSTELHSPDLVIIALMESDLHLVIKLIKQTTENGWFAAHLTNLLYLSDCLKIMDNSVDNVTSRLHEDLVSDYACLLMTHRSLWQVGLTYLDHCPSEGRARQELLLARVRFFNDKTALEVVRASRDRELFDIAYGTCKVMGRRMESRGHLGNALAWAIRSQDSAYVTSLANRLLAGYKQTGKFNSADFLDSLGAGMMLCDRLTFVGKYCEFHKLYGASQLQEAASLLVSLVEAKLAPKWFWLNLLMDSLPLLECKDVLFPTADLFKLMECMEELEEEQDDSQDLQMNLIRLAVARNLGRALVHAAVHPEDRVSDNSA